jgi:hypothetical protein
MSTAPPLLDLLGTHWELGAPVVALAWGLGDESLAWAFGDRASGRGRCALATGPAAGTEAGVAWP